MLRGQQLSCWTLTIQLNKIECGRSIFIHPYCLRAHCCLSVECHSEEWFRLKLAHSEAIPGSSLRASVCHKPLQIQCRQERFASLHSPPAQLKYLQFHAMKTITTNQFDRLDVASALFQRPRIKKKKTTN